MKTILSFLKPVGKGLDWLKWEFAMAWRTSKFDFFPSEKNLLISLWYSFLYFKTLRPGSMVVDFLDYRVGFIRRTLEDPQYSLRRRRYHLDLYNALHQPNLRKIIITFLESSPPEEHYLPVIKAMKRAWREDGQQAPVPMETQEEKESEQPDVPLAVPEAPVPEAGQPSKESKKDDPPGDAPGLHAKTYYIAAELYYELAGQQAEYQVLCRQLPELAAFVQEKFGAARLSGRFKKFKGYSYKTALKERNVSKKGQLKPLFRQIADNPRVFGKAIAERAREILAENFH